MTKRRTCNETCSACKRKTKHAIYAFGEKHPFCRGCWKIFLGWTKKQRA